jgi:hypothetical protein
MMESVSRWEAILQRGRQRLVEYFIARGPIGYVGATVIGVLSVVIVGVQMAILLYKMGTHRV